LARKYDSRPADRLSKQYGVPSINLDDFDIDPDVLALIPAPLAYKHLVVPIDLADDFLIVAFADPSSIPAQKEIAARVARRIEIVAAEPTQIKSALKRYYPAVWA
jgi:type IV pilus assembly protein PilB